MTTIRIAENSRRTNVNAAPCANEIESFA